MCSSRWTSAETGKFVQMSIEVAIDPVLEDLVELASLAEVLLTTTSGRVVRPFFRKGQPRLPRHE
jgi:hypothetical protein